MGSASVRFILTPLIDANLYGDDIDISDFVSTDSLPSISSFIDSEDYDIGIFSFGSIQIVCDNSTGGFNDFSDSRSVFNFYRDLSRLRVVFTETEITRDASGIVTASTATDTTLFRGLIRDEATRFDPVRDSVTFEVLSLESILSNVRIPPGQVVDGMLTTAAILAVLDDVKLDALIDVDPLNITPDLNLVVDNGGYFDALNGLDAIKQLLLATNSVLRINAANEILISDRSVDDVEPTINLYGKNDLSGRENIIDLTEFNIGFHRIANSAKSGSIESNDSGSITELGLRQKSIDLQFITSEATLQEIVDRVVSDFVIPKLECKVRVPMSLGSDVSLLQKVNINYPLALEPGGDFLPVVGGTSYGDTAAPYPIETGSISILPTTLFKIIEIEHDLNSMESVLKLRQAGTGFEDGYTS